MILADDFFDATVAFFIVYSYPLREETIFYETTTSKKIIITDEASDLGTVRVWKKLFKSSTSQGTG
jgi:hypothetical protein